MGVQFTILIVEYFCFCSLYR